MKTRLKSLAERLSGNRIWIEPASDCREVLALIKKLRPAAITRPLIRIGGAGDGGYLMPDDLDGITSCVSPGVAAEVGFDFEMAERGIDVHMADGSVEGPPIRHPRFQFLRKFVDAYEDERTTRLDMVCASITGRCSGDDARHREGDLILQMDIEGGEYRVILDTSEETLKSFRIIVIEFHDLTRLFSKFGFPLIQATFRKLLRFHTVVHVHPNNIARPTVRNGIAIPPVMEFTFYRKDRAVLDPAGILRFPHPLDRDNVARLPSSVLPDVWRSP